VSVAALVFDAPPAAGQTPDANVDCAAAFNDAGALREKHSLKDARARYQICSLPACPSFVSLCVNLAEEVAASIPSIVFQAHDGQGRAVTAVTVTVDGAPFAKGLVGAAIDVDPGKHTFAFEAEGYRPATLELVVPEGKKNQAQSVTLETLPVAPSAMATAPSQPAPVALPTVASGTRLEGESPAGGRWSAQNTLAVIAGGGALTAFAIGSVLGLKASSTWSSAKGECKPGTCGAGSQAQNDHDSAQSSATMSTVFFVAGGIAAAGGAVLWITAPSRRTTGLRAVPSVSARGAGLDLSGSF
jgi:hypothetical protein